MALAAGLGTRLRPLTSIIPKPLAPFLNKPLIDWVLDSLSEAGVEECLVNSHHLAGKLAAHLDKREGPPEITISHEPQILGTGGGVVKARDFFGAEPFLLQNSDCIITPDYQALLESHNDSRALATLVIKKHPEQQAYGEVKVGADGRVLDIAGLNDGETGPAEGGMFVGLHAISPEILESAPRDKKKFCIVRDLYLPLIKEGGTINAIWYKGPFIDIGTIKGYLHSNIWALARIEELFAPVLSGHEKLDGGVFIHESTDMPASIELQAPALIGAECRIRDGVRIGPDAIIGRGSEIGPGAHIERTVILPDSRIPSGMNVTGKLIMPKAAG